MAYRLFVGPVCLSALDTGKTFEGGNEREGLSTAIKGGRKTNAALRPLAEAPEFTLTKGPGGISRP